VAKDGATGWKTVLPDEQTIVEQTAARELTEHLKLVTGAEFQTIAEKEVPAGGAVRGVTCWQAVDELARPRRSLYSPSKCRFETRAGGPTCHRPAAPSCGLRHSPLPARRLVAPWPAAKR